MILGTFFTRSGVLSSVHAFVQSAIGPLFFIFIGVTFITSLSLLIRRWTVLKSEAVMTSWFSREALFLLNNLLFVGLFVICFWGVVFPVLSEAVGIIGQAVPALAGIFTGQKVTVGPPYYIRATAPLFAGLLLLMGVAPLSAWQYSTIRTIGKSIWKPYLASLIPVGVVMIAGTRSISAMIGYWLCALVLSVTLYEFWRAAWARHNAQEQNLLQALWQMIGKNRRRYGGYIIHIGVVLMALGIIGIEIFQTQTQGTIPQGGKISLGQYTIQFDSLAVFDTPDGRNVARAVLSVYKDGKYVGELHPRRDYYYESQQPMTIAGIRSTMEDDLYVILVDWQPLSTTGATFKVYHNPLVNWLWLGGFVFIAGAIVAAWPIKESERIVAHATVTAPLNA